GPSVLSGLDAVLVPGGFGERGSAGKIEAIRWARENKVPFFGICLGMQLAVIEYARNVAGLDQAQSTEFAPESEQPVIALMLSQEKMPQKRGTMRLGAYDCALGSNTLARRIYGAAQISERHRHRFEFNNEFRKPLSDA